MILNSKRTGILAIILITIIWFFPFNGYFFFWDQQFLFNQDPTSAFKNFYIWIDYLSAPGIVGPAAVSWTVYVLLFTISTALFGSTLGQYLFVTGLLIAGYLGYHKLLETLRTEFTKRKDGINTSFFAIAFTLNIYVALFLLGDFSQYFFFFIILPWFLWTTINLDDITIKKVSFHIISSLLIAQCLSQPAFLVTILAYLIIIAILILQKKNLFKKIIYLGISFTIFILMFAHVLVPTLMAGREQFDANTAAVGGSDYLTIYKPYSTVDKVITLSNFRLLTNKNYSKFAPWVETYSQSTMLKVFLVLHLIILLSYIIFSKKIEQELRIKIGLIIVIAIFLVSMPYLIFGPLNYLWQKIPIIQVLRGWEQKMGHFFIYSSLFATYVCLATSSNKISRRILQISSIILIGILIYPAITGDFLFNRNQELLDNPYGNGISSRITLPAEYIQLKELFSNETYARVLIYPRDQVLSSDFFSNTSGYAGANVYSRLIGQQTIVNYNGDNIFSQKVNNEIYNHELNESLITNINDLGITHILIRKTYNNNSNFIWINKNSVENLSVFFDDSFTKIESNKYFDIYFVQDLEKVSTHEKPFRQLTPALYKYSIDEVKENITVKTFLKKSSNWKLVEISKNNILCNIEIIPQFCEVYVLTKSKFSNNDFDQYKLNSEYNMSWDIPPSDIKSNSKLYLVFSPQIYGYIGIFITIISILIILILTRQYEKL